jgi:adenine-specific DNA-methyltransferase
MLDRPPTTCVVYTPDSLASAMAFAVGTTQGSSFLEPCVGNGSLVKALSAQGVDRSSIRAVELDQNKSEADKYAKVLRGRDFLSWSLSTKERFDSILSNPPYLALHRLPNRLRENALRIVDPFSSRPISLGSNYWHAFLCASLHLLRDNGSMCFLLPAAWEFADYAKELRNSLPNKFREFEIHRSRTPLFAGLQEGSVVLVAHGFRQVNKRSIRTEHQSLPEIANSLYKPAKSEQVGDSNPAVLSPSLPCKRLNELVKIRIGAVTGHAAFFLLTEDERLRRKLPIASCVRVISRSSHLTDATLTLAKWNRLRQAKERVWLFRPSNKDKRVKTVQKYLQLPAERGGCDRGRFKVHIRTPWYEVSLPDNAHGFVSGMATHGPAITLSGMPGLNATNTLYVVEFAESTSAHARAGVALSLLSSPARTSWKKLARRYADGLLKVEPGDLGKVVVPVGFSTRGAIGAYRQAFALYRKGKVDAARDFADAWILRRIAADKSVGKPSDKAASQSRVQTGASG